MKIEVGWTYATHGGSRVVVTSIDNFNSRINFRWFNNAFGTDVDVLTIERFICHFIYTEESIVNRVLIKYQNEV